MDSKVIQAADGKLYQADPSFEFKIGDVGVMGDDGLIRPYVGGDIPHEDIKVLVVNLRTAFAD